MKEMWIGYQFGADAKGEPTADTAYMVANALANYRGQYGTPTHVRLSETRRGPAERGWLHIVHGVVMEFGIQRKDHVYVRGQAGVPHAGETSRQARVRGERATGRKPRKSKVSADIPGGY